MMVDIRQLQGAVLMLVVIGIMATVGLDVFTDLEDDGAVRLYSNNNSRSLVNGTNITLYGDYYSNLVITNASMTLGSGNYTTYADDSVIFPHISSCCNDSATWYFSYKSFTTEITGNASVGISNITERFGILGTVIAFAILIGLVVFYLRFR